MWRGVIQDKEKLIRMEVYRPLLSLLSRHTQTLTQRAHSSSLPPNDEVATGLIPELGIIIGLLQGLCLLSRACKDAVSESWVLEVCRCSSFEY